MADVLCYKVSLGDGRAFISEDWPADELESFKDCVDVEGTSITVTVIMMDEDALAQIPEFQGW